MEVDSNETYKAEDTVTFDTRELKLYSVTPISETEAYCAQNVNLALYNKDGKRLKELKTKCKVRGLCLHPVTNELYGTFVDGTVCIIDKETGATKQVFKCPYAPYCITITQNGEFIVAEYWISPGNIFFYSKNWQLLKTSAEKYQAYDLAFNNENGKLVISCCVDGVKILDDNLSHELAKQKLGCNDTAIWFKGNVIIGDKKEVHILSGEDLSFITKFPLEEMSHPMKMRLFNRTFWLECLNHHRFVITKIQHA